MKSEVEWSTPITVYKLSDHIENLNLTMKLFF